MFFYLAVRETVSMDITGESNGTALSVHLLYDIRQYFIS